MRYPPIVWPSTLIELPALTAEVLSIDKSLNYGDYFDAANISPTAVNVSSKWGTLSICSTDKNILDKLKDLFESNGNKLISNL